MKNTNSKKIYRQIKNGLKFGVLLIFIITLLLQINIGQASEVPESEKASGQILSKDFVSNLTRECNTEKIFLEAWLPNVNMETVPTEEEKKKEEKLRKEITQILRACLKKELEAINCSDISCIDVDSGLRELRENILAKYFLDDRNMWNVNSEHGDSVAWEMYQKKLEQCYQKIFDNCDCNMQGLLNLWADLKLNDVNTLDSAKRFTLIEKVKSKYEECLKSRIAEMEDVEKMMGLIFKKDKKDEYGLTLRDDTLYDNSNIAQAILKRLIQLYGLNINLDDKYFSSRCCDKFLYLKDLYSWLKEYYLLGYPQLTRPERGRWDEENMIKFLRHMKAMGDPYMHCRILELDQCDCNPNKLCNTLGCKEHMVGEFKKSMERQLNDSREQEFLDVLQRRIKECIGIDVELKDFIDFCAYAPVNKSWENLKKRLERKEAEKNGEFTEEEKEKLVEDIKKEAAEFERKLKGAKKSEEKIRIEPGSINIGKTKVPIPEEKKINISLKKKPMNLKVSSKKVSLEEEGIKVDIKLPIEISKGKIKFKNKEIKITPREAISEAKIKQLSGVELIGKDEKPVYEIKTIEKRKLFFIFPVKIERKILIDANQGNKIGEKKPWWSFLAW